MAAPTKLRNPTILGHVPHGHTLAGFTRDVTVGKFLVQPLQCLGGICPPFTPGWNRVKVSENLGGMVVALVTPAVTSLFTIGALCLATMATLHLRALHKTSISSSIAILISCQSKLKKTIYVI